MKLVGRLEITDGNHCFSEVCSQPDSNWEERDEFGKSKDMWELRRRYEVSI